MGIVNVTPDSFSDGGRFFDADAAVAHGVQLAQAGADILDIGGESTRPNAAAVTADDELDRVLPVVEALRDRVETPISIDTSKAAVAAACIEAGVEIVNDVTGFAGDPAMVPLVADTGVAVCVMHMQGSPRTMQVDPSYDDVVADIRQYLDSRVAALVDGGVDAQRICIDPGIGFGKTVDHNLDLIRNAAVFVASGHPVLYGHSRKSFLGSVLGDVHADRDAATVAVSLQLADRGVQILRVHDVAGTVQALQVRAALAPER